MNYLFKKTYGDPCLFQIPDTAEKIGAAKLKKAKSEGPEEEEGGAGEEDEEGTREGEVYETPGERVLTMDVARGLDSTIHTNMDMDNQVRISAIKDLRVGFLPRPTINHACLEISMT